MSNTNVLFDVPGPRAMVRHRLYSVLAAALLVVVLGYMAWRLYEHDQFDYAKWEPFFSPVYIQAWLVDGVFETLKMAFSAVILAVVFGVFFGVGKLSEHGLISWPCWAVIEFWRAVPLLLSMFFIFAVWGISWENAGPYWSVVIALTLYNGAVLAEVFRAGINAVPKGQVEAAYALGMRKTQVMVAIQLPQAVKIMLPALISQCVVALKDTSLGYVVVAPGLTRVGQQIYGSPNFDQNHIAVAIMLAATYIVLNLILTWVATWVQKKFVGEKKVIDITTVAAGVQEQPK